MTAQAYDYSLTFTICGVVALLALPILRGLSANAGAAVSGHDMTGTQKDGD
ncbi:hypothetical protein [Komagataeibacter kakiaceti]|uniref:hypothetical protein n=1 Tax=Komagataeibacter kakiaceti TaxID=943261 RepID=UPI000B0A025A|nr:hypothetical protein [Komagataeibacter kakiaceti]